MSSAFVCLLGIGTVFFGLVCIVVLCYIMSAVCNMFGKEGTEAPKATPVAPATVSKAKVENKQEIIAAVACAIAEELGTDVEGIRIKSFKKL